MRRGDVITGVAPGDFGKPRPAVVIQSDLVAQAGSVLVCLITSTLREAPDYRLAVGPGDGTGLVKPSQVQIDRIMALAPNRVGVVIGRLSDELIAELDRRLAFMIGLGI